MLWCVRHISMLALFCILVPAHLFSYENENVEPITRLSNLDKIFVYELAAKGNAHIAVNSDLHVDSSCKIRTNTISSVSGEYIEINNGGGTRLRVNGSSFGELRIGENSLYGGYSGVFDKNGRETIRLTGNSGVFELYSGGGNPTTFQAGGTGFATVKIMGEQAPGLGPLAQFYNISGACTIQLDGQAGQIIAEPTLIAKTGSYHTVIINAGVVSSGDGQAILELKNYLSDDSYKRGIEMYGRHPGFSGPTIVMFRESGGGDMWSIELNGQSGVVYSNGVGLTSDSRVKTDTKQVNVHDILARIQRCPVYTYKWIPSFCGTSVDEQDGSYGLIAQDVVQHFPECVDTHKTATIDGQYIDDFHALNYGQLTSLAFAGIQALEQRNAQTESKLHDFKEEALEQIRLLQAQVTELQDKIAQATVQDAVQQ